MVKTTDFEGLIQVCSFSYGKLYSQPKGMELLEIVVEGKH